MTRDKSLKDLAGNDASSIPRPHPHYLLRFGVPLFVSGCALALLAVTTWNALVPARTVEAVTVVVRQVEQTVPANQENMGSLIQAPGWVEPDPFANYVPALTEGVVNRILVLEGDPIETGEVVATLVDDEARIQVEKSEADLALARAKRELAVANLTAAEREQETLVGPTRRVAVAKAGLYELQARHEELGAEIVAARATREELEDELNRKEGLVESGAVAEAVVVRLGKRVEAGTAAIESLEKQLEATAARSIAAQAEVTAAEEALQLQITETLAVEGARASLAEADAMIKLAETARKDARLVLERCRVRSPVDGIVIERLTSPGSTINFGNGTHGAHILHVYDPKSLQVRADIPLADASRVGVGQKAEIVVDLLPNQVFNGEVTRFLHKADIQKNTVEAKVRILDPSPLLKPEMLARVRILPAGDGDAGNITSMISRVFVPEDAIARDQEGSTIWVIDGIDRGRGRAARRPILVGDLSSDGWVEVIEGLNPGDKVILDGTDLTPGDPVELGIEGEA